VVIVVEPHKSLLNVIYREKQALKCVFLQKTNGLKIPILGVLPSLWLSHIKAY